MHKPIISTMKTVMLCLVFLFSGVGIILAQDSIPAKSEKKPLVKPAFESGYFIADQTVITHHAKTLELVLQHDFGTIQNHATDLFGLWGASNIRLGLNYSITNDLQVGIGTTKNNRIQNIQLKYAFAHQREGGFPLTIAYFFNWDINCTDKVNFGDDFKTTDRFSYFNEFMFSRRFGKHISLQLGLAWVHYNIVDSTMKDNYDNDSYINDNINISGIGRYKITPQTSIIASYSQSVLSYLNTPPWPNFGLGVEISTSTHCFQIFLTSAQGILPQENAMYNKNNPYNGAILLGFNITRLWNF
jgi:hypothetical protein